MLQIVEAEAEAAERNAGFQPLDEVTREARQLIGNAMDLEVAEYIERNQLERDEQGHLCGPSTGDFRATLPILLGKEALRLSPNHRAGRTRKGN